MLCRHRRGACASASGSRHYVKGWQCGCEHTSGLWGERVERFVLGTKAIPARSAPVPRLHHHGVTRVLRKQAPAHRKRTFSLLSAQSKGAHGPLPINTYLRLLLQRRCSVPASLMPARAGRSVLAGGAAAISSPFTADARQPAPHTTTGHALTAVDPLDLLALQHVRRKARARACGQGSRARMESVMGARKYGRQPAQPTPDSSPDMATEICASSCSSGGKPYSATVATMSRTPCCTTAIRCAKAPPHGLWARRRARSGRYVEAPKPRGHRLLPSMHAHAKLALTLRSGAPCSSSPILTLPDASQPSQNV